MTKNYYTENLADFGFREIKMLSQILNAWVENGLPNDFYTEGVRAAFNRNSGNVFLTNDEYQVAMMNGGNLESFYTTPYEGHEGFLEELLENDPTEYHHEDIEFITEIAKSNSIELPKPWMDFMEPK
ncbi:hypothetical protein A4D02_35385 [Niastella koreensis]|uniref:Uncharacterized protein n=2 Tax=Niastella koreensis TaxID=354356 RepID=G8TJH5_NIAKG|nr:hypothetical protein [Niastella koreensis]AEV99710.1 hypothetical protein Niako_3404 [Niastella koreensis GR20-10]OQP44265.1 hypothetical protein A4D02_35385 [Niastella koreensis]